MVTASLKETSSAIAVELLDVVITDVAILPPVGLGIMQCVMTPTRTAADNANLPLPAPSADLAQGHATRKRRVTEPAHTAPKTRRGLTAKAVEVG